MEKYLKNEGKIYNLLDIIAKNAGKNIFFGEDEEKTFLIKVENKEYQVRLIKKKINNEINYTFILQNDSKVYELKRQSFLNSENKEYRVNYLIKSNISSDERRVRVELGDDWLQDVVVLDKNPKTAKTIEKAIDLTTGKVKRVFDNPITYLESNERIMLPLVNETYFYNEKDNKCYLLTKDDVPIDVLTERLDLMKKDIIREISKLKELNINGVDELSLVIEKIDCRRDYLNLVKKQLLFSKDKLFKLPGKLDFFSDSELEEIATQLTEKVEEFISEDKENRSLLKKRV